jgi:ribose 5-phosphate isomerase RpiB
VWKDDNMNVICLGGRVTGYALAWEMIQAFLSDRFSGAERHWRRLGEGGQTGKQGRSYELNDDLLPIRHFYLRE